MTIFPADPDHNESDAQPWLIIRHATVQRGRRYLVDDLNLRLRTGQHTALLGPNGSGKSTLVKLITSQLYPLAGGEVRVFGEARWSIFELRRHLGIVSSSLQLDYDGDPPLEVFDCVVSGFFAARGVWTHHKVTAEMEAKAQEALSRVRAGHLVGRPMSELSTGEARRVLIARALVHRPQVLLLDEPCAGLDPAARQSFLDDLSRIAGQGVTLLLVTHHIEEILPEIDHVLMMRDGRVLCEGAKAELLSEARLSELFGVNVAVERYGDWFHSRISPSGQASGDAL